ncbi:MAG TPA: ABC transporter permease [Vicinamibacterales bacterium]|nr:ABC transporter permease [Vicinamibacterales bacterium]
MQRTTSTVDRWFWFDDVARDIRYSARSWRRRPAFATVAVLTLAVAIGAVTTVFSTVEAVLLRPLPYADADRLVAVWDGHVSDRNLAKIFASYADFDLWRRESRTLDQVAAVTWATGERTLTGHGDPRVVLAIPVSVNFFALLGVPASIGRTFEAEDLTHGCMLVLGSRFWRTSLSGSADVVGRSLALDGRACTVVGVMPDAFSFYPAAADMWTLITATREQLPQDRYQGVGVFGRLRPGVTRERANQELSALHGNAHAGDPHGKAFAPTVYPLQDEFTWLAGRNLRVTLWVLFGAVAIVLVIASVNVGNLLLGRSMARQRELAIRAAIGSGRWRLARQILIEALMLSGAAVAVGLGIAAAALRYLRTQMPVDLPPAAVIAVDGTVVTFAIAVALLTAIVFGTLPAWRSSRGDVQPVLKAYASSVGAPTNRLSTMFVGIQVACAMALLVGAGLLIQSIVRLGSVPLGFNTDGILTMSLRLPRAAYTQPDRRADFYERLVSDLAASPGVQGAALTTALLRGGGLNLVLVEGRPDPMPETTAPDAGLDSVSPDYFRVMGVPLVAGRAFRAGDNAGAPPVSIVSGALARKYFPDGDAVGRRIRTPNTSWSTIVGIVGDQKTMSVFQEMKWIDTPMIFRPVAQTTPLDVSLAVNSAAPASIGAALQRRITALDSGVAVANIQTLRDRLAKDFAYPEFRAAMLTGFAAIALLLAAVGLYAVLSQVVTERTAEFGLRMALGARTTDIARLVAVQGGIPTAIGLVSGVAAAMAIARVLSGLLFGVSAADPWSIAGVALVLGVAAAAAMYVPARRASRIDPLTALRSE